MSIADDPRKSLLSDSAAGRARALGRVRSALSFRTISAIYIFAALFVLFSLWVPSTFLTVSVWKSLIDDQALTALVAIGLVIPLASGSFNLAVGTEVGMAGVFVAWLLTHESLPIVPAIAIALLGGAAVGTVSGLLIVRAKIDSFIATLGISSILTALTAWLSNSEQILNLGNGFSAISNDQFLGLTWPVWIMLGAAIIVWYVLGRTSVGRRVYATGGNPSAARLAGVRTSRRSGCDRRDPAERTAQHRGSHDRTRLSAPGLCGRVSGLHATQRGPLQRLGHGDRGVRTRHRGQGPAARRRPRLDPRSL
jgi:predicted ABC-type sugar transport system permease subunit